VVVAGANRGVSIAELRYSTDIGGFVMLKFALLLMIGLLFCGAAHAACSTSTSITTTTGVNTPFATSDDGSGNCESKFNFDQVGGTKVVGDACQVNAHTLQTISFATTPSLPVVVGVASKRIFICHISIETTTGTVAAAIFEGTGNTCTGSPQGVIGGATTGTGILLSTTPYVAGDGMAAIAATQVNADNLCFSFASSQQVSGELVTVTQ